TRPPRARRPALARPGPAAPHSPAPCLPPRARPSQRPRDTPSWSPESHRPFPSQPPHLTRITLLIKATPLPTQPYNPLTPAAHRLPPPRKPDSGYADTISTPIRVRRPNWNAMKPRFQCVRAFRGFAVWGFLVLAPPGAPPGPRSRPAAAPAR